MKNREEARKRTEMLKRLRDIHRDTVEQTQASLKTQKKIQQQICQVIREQARTVPEVAQATGLTGHEVLWHITAMKKYGLIVETGMCGDYYLYQKVEEKGK
jgi:predicted transcriptional regulator